MSYHKEDDDEMIQSMVDCGGMTKEMAKDKVRRREGRRVAGLGMMRMMQNVGGRENKHNTPFQNKINRFSHAIPPLSHLHSC